MWSPKEVLDVGGSQQTKQLETGGPVIMFSYTIFYKLTNSFTGNQQNEKR
jgi:hypothetical protein